jgi:hypothetical protein
MIVADTETIMLAWYSLLKSTLGNAFASYDRRFQKFRDITNKPALRIRQTGPRDDYDGEGLPLTTIMGEIWIIDDVKPDAIGETQLNVLATAVRAASSQLVNFVTTSDGTAFATDADGDFITEEPDDTPGDDRQTVGDLVYRARIEGQSIYDNGDFDGLAKAKIPFAILVPSDG